MNQKELKQLLQGVAEEGYGFDMRFSFQLDEERPDRVKGIMWDRDLSDYDDEDNEISPEDPSNALHFNVRYIGSLEGMRIVGIEKTDETGTVLERHAVEARGTSVFNLLYN